LKILGVDLPHKPVTSIPTPSTVVLLGDDGTLVGVARAGTLPEVAAEIGRLAGGEPFLAGVDIPVVVSSKPSRSRPVESTLRRRLGFRLAPGGRGSRAGDTVGIAGETLIAGLAAAGQPCLPYPDRDRRKPGLAETYPALILKALLWETSPLASLSERDDLPDLFRAYRAPTYRAASVPAKMGWAERLGIVDQVLQSLTPGAAFDLEPARQALEQATSLETVERAAGLLDAILIAGMAKRYLDSPESSLFVGDRESGYVILPADAFIRRLGSDTQPRHGRLFPTASLRQRIGKDAKLRSADLLAMPGRPSRLDAEFGDPPLYEFDNLDEMMWWKHMRHLAGPALVTEGLTELVIVLGDQPDTDSRLKLVRSRHTTLSFRFAPPTAWRKLIATRDGKTYKFRILRATYQTAP